MNWGAPKWHPKPPKRSARPGVAVARLDSAPIARLDGAPQAARAGSL
jgi:hypothetical protein